MCFVDAVDHIVIGTVIQEVKTSNIAREVKKITSITYVKVMNSNWIGTSPAALSSTKWLNKFNIYTVRV